MQLPVIVLALILSCSFAAPLEKVEEPPKRSELIRPSPINPDIPSDPKPDEKITLINDPQVLPLTSTVPPKLKGPFVLPRELLLREKREDKDSSESEESSSSGEEDDAKASRPLAVKPVSSIIKPSTSTAAPPHTVSVSGAVTSSTAAPIPTHPRIPYAPEIHQHNEHLFKPSTSTSTTTTSTTTSTPSPDHVNDKRDIPVPLTRKFPQSDEADDEKTKPKPEEEQSTSSSTTTTTAAPSITNEPKEETKEEESKDGNKKTEPAEQHPAPFARPIPVAELFAKKPSTK